MQIGTFSTYVSGVDLVVEWKIENFFNLPEMDGAWYDSSLFSFGGERWSLWIYPNGSSGSDSSGHVDLRLNKYFPDPIKQSFSLFFKTAEGEKYNEQNVTKDFQKGWDCHPFNRFIQRSDLTRRRYELVPDGVLTVVCTMKSSTSAGSATGKELKENSENTGVNASTQTEEKDTCVEACTQTVEERLGYEPERAYVEACTQTLEEEFSFNNPPEDCGFVTDINHLLKENRGVDVTFELETPNGKTKLFAHKLILAVMSSYFADEFYDKGRNDGHQVIPLKGIDPKAFEQMIRYCYGGKPSLITTKEVCALFKVAFEFKVISLQNLCYTFFKRTKIEPGNVFSILKISMEMEDKSLQDLCYQIVQEKTREVMAAYELCDITPAMVYTLLKSPKLSLNSEYELIKWIFDWAKVKSEDAREYLERLLKEMNFLALRFKEFATLCKDYQGFFNSDEIVSIYQNIAHAGAREMPEWFNNDLKCRVYTGSNE